MPATNLDRSTDGNETPTPIPTAIVPIKPTYTVKRGEIVDELEFSGRIAPVVEEDLFFRNSGRVRAVFYKRNDFVEEGQVIAELEIDPLERELESAELELERSQVRLDQALEDTNTSSVWPRRIWKWPGFGSMHCAARPCPIRPPSPCKRSRSNWTSLRSNVWRRGIDPLLDSDVERAELNVSKLKADIAESQIIAPFAGNCSRCRLCPARPSRPITRSRRSPTSTNWKSAPT